MFVRSIRCFAPILIICLEKVSISENFKFRKQKCADQLFKNAFIDLERKPSHNPTTFETKKSIVKEFLAGYN